MKPTLLVPLSLLTSVAFCYSPCAKRTLIDPSELRIVCVCNATYCDDVPPLGSLTGDEAAVYVSSKSGKRFERTTLHWTHSQAPGASNLATDANKDEKVVKQVHITPNVKMQSIIGFGGAFTDSAGIGINSLEHATQEHLMQAYFGHNGIQYSLGRVPMASCDFSTHEYSYDDTNGDFSLQHFALAPEDHQYKIPYIKRALELTTGALKLFTSPRSAPGWMKTIGHMIGGGTLKPGGAYDQTWAHYFVRFFEEYYRNGIPFWGLTVQNEPSYGADGHYSFQAMYFSFDSERDFIKNYLGPALRNSTLGKNIVIMAGDDQRTQVHYWAKTVFSDPVASSYTAGIATHWYQDHASPPSVFTLTHNEYPSKFILATEACTGGGVGTPPQGPLLGAWFRGDLYAHSIISNLNNWVTGWTDWNLVLDINGGPNIVNHHRDAPILVDASKGEFYKEPMFYNLGHFSKFIRPDSVRIGQSVGWADDLLEGVVVTTPTNERVFVIRNAYTVSFDLHIDVADRPGQTLLVSLHPESITTIIWK